jgi:hypothetical protein
MALYILLNDGETFTSLEGCQLIDVPEHDDLSAVDAEYIYSSIDSGYLNHAIQEHPDEITVYDIDERISETDDNGSGCHPVLTLIKR